MNDWTIVAFVLIALLLFAVVFKRFFDAVEHQYVHVFHKPFFVHWYLSKKQLTYEQLEILHKEFPFYNRLSDKQKKYFEHRIAVFLDKYPFEGKEGFQITDRVKVLIAATSTMLTFGMRSYLYSYIAKVIVYPDRYYSIITQQYHKGEFNPGAKIVVFSWSDFEHGLFHVNDNLNLGIHEFAHALHFQGMKNDNVSSYLFALQFKNIQRDVNYLPNKEKLLESDFFRKYAYTNQFEFIAVVLEYFFESPHEFQKEFPQLFLYVKRMINFSRYIT